MNKLLKTYLTAGLLIAAGAAFGQKPAVVADSDPGWHRIGDLNASFKKQDESIHVMGNDEFTALKLKVKDAPIHIERMQVFYESGEMENIDVKSEMKAGASSGALQLKHAGRDISKIAFTYHSVANNNAEKADVEIFGLKTEGTSYSNEAKEEAREAKREANETANEVEREADKTADKIDAKGERAENDIERAAEKTADEVSEAAAKTAAEIDDKKLDTKVGPDGQAIYVSDDHQYYYINEEGKRVFVKELQLKDK